VRLFGRKKPAVPIRGVHLDLKGLPPTPKRLLEVLDLLAEARVNCVLVEWEDTYPWRRHPEFRCETAYSTATVRRFRDRAEKLGIEVVPLVQCFGHLQTVLSKKRFRAMRELADSPGDICPSHPGAVGVVLDMIEDVLETHGGRIGRFHLGGDEVWSLGSCPKCRRAVKKSGKAALYMKHVSPLLDALRERGLTPILWDDMMRKWSARELRELAPRAELMAWAYGPDPFVRLPAALFGKYAKAGVTVWGASAFKGADGLSVDTVNTDTRIADLTAWAGSARRLGLAGIVATGWSRYSTFAVPCEGLEPSLHSLVLAGASMWDGRLPRDAEAEAMRFLAGGRRRALAGERFVRCLEASRALKEWRGGLQRLVNRSTRFAAVAGEPERVDERGVSGLLKASRDHVARGEKLAKEWVRAHAGLVPRVWLERYAESRVWPAREIGRLIQNRAEDRTEGRTGRKARGKT
jgi:hexosaminidase